MGLIPDFADEVFDLVKEPNRDGMTVHLVERNAKKVQAVADRTYVLKTGRIVLHDSAENLARTPRSRRPTSADAPKFLFLQCCPNLDIKSVFSGTQRKF